MADITFFLNLFAFEKQQIIFSPEVVLSIQKIGTERSRKMTLTIFLLIWLVKKENLDKSAYVIANAYLS